MKAELIIVKPGLLTTLQDMGRWGYQQFGVPVSGAMDRYALQVANLLAGNDRAEGALEITMTGFETLFTADCLVAIAGADLGLQLNDREIKPWQSFTVRSGESLKTTALKSGSRAYIAVHGGFVIPKVMGSISTHTRGGIGGLEGRALIKEDRLEIKPYSPSNLPPEIESLGEFIQIYSDRPRVRCILGPQDGAFSPGEIDKFFKSSYTLTAQSDRMGYRFKGEALKHLDDFNIITEGLTLGAIQIIGEGQPIVMMADHQSAGGYTKIAHVISVDMSKLAQLQLGDEIYFHKTDIEEAQKLLAEQEDLLRHLEKFCFETRKSANIVKETPPAGRRFKVKVNGVSYNIYIE